MARILVIDDKASMRAMVERVLGEAHAVDTAADATDGLTKLANADYDLLLSDVRLPDLDGFAVLARAREMAPDTEVVLMTAYATVEAAVEAVKAGAYDYVAKPFEPDDLLLTVSRALERRSLRARARAAERALRHRDGLDEMLGEGAAMQKVRFLIERVCDLDVTVLVTGESGTGKEVVARAIHQAGARRERPFVAVNCGAIPENLIESELFGHTKGAFTGADQARTGLVEEAGEGTLFLDEIGDLPIDLQVKLNRALQERRFRRVGEGRERPVRARIVAATHRDLRQAVEAGSFREDLFFRLNVYPITLPPLRARGEDLFLLARHFLGLAAARFDRPVTGFTPEALGALARYDWPGNVRELQHTMERAVILADTAQVGVDDLPDALSGGGGGPPRAEGPLPPLAKMSYKDALEWGRDRTLKLYLDALLRRFEGNVSHAAKQAGIERESLHRLLRKADLDAAYYRR